MIPGLYEPSSEKLGMFQVRLLLMLKERPMYGLEITEELERNSGWRPSPGTIYPALKRLGEKGFISFERTTSSGNKRKVYHLTEKGEEQLKKILSLTCHYYDCKLRERLKDFYEKAVECARIENGDMVLVSPPDPDLLDICKREDNIKVLTFPPENMDEISGDSVDTGIVYLGGLSSKDDRLAPIKTMGCKIRTGGRLVVLGPEKSDNIWLESFFQYILGAPDYGFTPEELEGLLKDLDFSDLDIFVDKGFIIAGGVK